MRIVLAGGAGFIGSHLARALLLRGDDVLVVDDFITGSAANLTSLHDAAGLTVLEHDVSTPLAVDGDVDAILHLASPASPPDYHAHPVETLNAGTFATYHLLELAAATGARFLLASTSEVYGDPLEHPQRETYWGHVNPVGPRSVYDEAKRCAEAYTMAYHRAGVSTRIARIFNTYGPQMRLNDGRAVPNFIAQALAGTPLTVYGDGSQTRSLCYVDDLVRGLVLLLDSDEHMPVNLGNPAEITILELAHAIAELTGRPRDAIEFRELPEDDPRQRRPDITRARERLGWEPAIPLHDGLMRTLTWARATTG